MNKESLTPLTRRELLTTSATLAVAATANANSAVKTMKNVPFERKDNVRIGFVGCGGRGSGLISNLLGCEGTTIVALCDIAKGRAENAQKMAVRKGQEPPALYTNGERDFENLCKRGDLDIVINATPWDWHVPIALCAMEHGIHTATEVPAATALADCWKLVDTSEKTRKHCIMLENCCYGYNEMLVNRLVHDGVLGDITYGEAAYLHNLRGLLLADSGEGLWRRFPHIKRNANLYPTHGLGPVAWYMDIHKGDRFDFLVSVSSKEGALSEYRDAHVPTESPKRREKYACGDRNTSIIRTVKGRMILLQHDVVTPRPYSRLNEIAGTKGTFSDYPERICVDGQKEGEEWVSIDRYKAKYEDPLWTNFGEIARKNGSHGGMDFLMLYRLIQCFREGTPPDMDVYDAAAWSAPFPLSEQSVAKRGRSVDFPDFTRGHWEK
jgi:predicted dehydrogenase